MPCASGVPVLEYVELAAAVLRPHALTGTLDGRLLLAVALRLDAGLGIGDAEVHEVVADLDRAEIAEREVVLVGAALVAVALDDHDARRVGREVLRDGLGLGQLALRDEVGVEAEVDRREVDVRAADVVGILVERHAHGGVHRNRVRILHRSGRRGELVLLVDVRVDVLGAGIGIDIGGARRAGIHDLRAATRAKLVVVVLAARDRNGEDAAERNRHHRGILHLSNSLGLKRT